VRTPGSSLPNLTKQRPVGSMKWGSFARSVVVLLLALFAVSVFGLSAWLAYFASKTGIVLEQFCAVEALWLTGGSPSQRGASGRAVRIELQPRKGLFSWGGLVSGPSGRFHGRLTKV
jgi:hypothetical protein